MEERQDLAKKALMLNYRSSQNKPVKTDEDLLRLESISEKLDILARDHYEHYAVVLAQHTPSQRAIQMEKAKIPLAQYIRSKEQASKTNQGMGLQIAVACSYVGSVTLMATYLSRMQFGRNRYFTALVVAGLGVIPSASLLYRNYIALGLRPT